MLCPSGRLAQSKSTHFEGSKSGDPKSEGSSATVMFFSIDGSDVGQINQSKAIAFPSFLGSRNALGFSFELGEEVAC